jgi:hypothetical protein
MVKSTAFPEGPTGSPGSQEVAGKAVGLNEFSARRFSLQAGRG